MEALGISTFFTWISGCKWHRDARRSFLSAFKGW